MVYARKCIQCHWEFDVVRSAAEMELSDPCVKCGAEAIYQFTPSIALFSGTRVESPEYNPGLGCIVNNSAHRREIAKQKGLIEIGNEKAESLHRHYDKARDDARERAWADTSKGWVGSDG